MLCVHLSLRFVMLIIYYVILFQYKWFYVSSGREKMLWLSQFVRKHPLISILLLSVKTKFSHNYFTSTNVRLNVYSSLVSKLNPLQDWILHEFLGKHYRKHHPNINIVCRSCVGILHLSWNPLLTPNVRPLHTRKTNTPQGSQYCYMFRGPRIMCVLLLS